MTMQAIKDKVFVKVQNDIEQVTKGGLIVPGTVKKEPQKYGTVISVGNDVKEIQCGDQIMYHDRGGQTVIIDGEEYRILSDNEIYGVLSRAVKPTSECCGH